MLLPVRSRVAPRASIRKSLQTRVAGGISAVAEGRAVQDRLVGRIGRDPREGVFWVEGGEVGSD
jgi:hypothetical protein